MDKQTNCLFHHGFTLIKHGQLTFAHPRQDKLVHRLPAPFDLSQGPSNTNFHARKILGSDMLNDRPDAIMPPGTTSTHEFDSARLKIYVIMQNKQVLPWNFKIIDKAANTLTGAVHIGLRLHQEDLSIKGSSLTVEPLHFQGIRLPSQHAGKMINEEKTDIVAC